MSIVVIVLVVLIVVGLIFALLRKDTLILLVSLGLAVLYLLLNGARLH